ncbi:YvrJ protein family protein [Alteribacillus persepolensis]|uniref:YvrJ protein family protein n=1 Tax=Alteribacillus persepolensis TaxID=568899 RepID=A0A1G8GLP3_9BACI|nr:YvrJ family protein [Alteribacillus persepolensis]SDH95335.1 YvrJ protein family protein [Alteribacillus persepolensis]
MDMWIQAAGEYGISAVIAFYLLHRMEKKLDTLIDAVQQQNNTPFPFKQQASHHVHVPNKTKLNQ